MATLVASPSLARALVLRWYVTVPGLVLSLALAAGATIAIPPQYASTSTVALIPAPQKGGNSLLTSTSGLSTSAEIVVQAMSDPEVAKDLGLVSGKDAVTTVNGSANSSGKIIESSGPFISVTAQSSSATRATALAEKTTSLIEQKLKDLQDSVKVKKQQSIGLSPVINPTPGKLVIAMLLRTSGLAMLFGCLLTIGAVCLIDRRARRRKALAPERAADEREAPLAALRPSGVTLQRRDKFDGGDVVVPGQSPELGGELGRRERKAPVNR